ncbi:MAG: alkaline phosphatase [Gemmatimonadota bacterium]|nr:alkaline phosphatase [Gemmatimonadota bacterium]
MSDGSNTLLRVLGLAVTAVASAAAALLTPVSGLAASPVTEPGLEATVAGAGPIVGAVGDMACDPADSRFNDGAGTTTACQQSQTSNVVVADASLTAVLGLGDYQYDCGDPADYAVSYNPTWGRLDQLMNPTLGNHEYQTGTDSSGATCPTTNTSAEPYFQYFGAAAHPDTNGHFSFDLGTWHLIALNANCRMAGGCGATSAQTRWLQADLEATTQPCVLAFWHQPRFSGAGTGSVAAYKPWWQALYAAHADVVLNGHRHNYQRFAPLTPDGVVDQAAGITEYIVGTGGVGLHGVKSTATPAPVFWKKTFGYLRMILDATSWSAEFIDYRGTTLDTSTGACHT